MLWNTVNRVYKCTKQIKTLVWSFNGNICKAISMRMSR